MSKDFQDLVYHALSFNPGYPDSELLVGGGQVDNCLNQDRQDKRIFRIGLSLFYPFILGILILNGGLFI